METRRKLNFQVVATHVPTLPLEVDKKEEVKNLLKCGKVSFYVIVDSEVFTYLKNKKWLVLAVNKPGFAYRETRFVQAETENCPRVKS